jgi:hypothetical protein
MDPGDPDVSYPDDRVAERFENNGCFFRDG